MTKLPIISDIKLQNVPIPGGGAVKGSHHGSAQTSDTWHCLTGAVSRIIGSGIRNKLGIWRDNLGDRHLASSLVAGDPGELGELTLSATLTQTQAFGEFGLKLYTDTWSVISVAAAAANLNIMFLL